MSVSRVAALSSLVLAAAIWLVFWPATHANFVGWNDPLMVFQNPGLNPPSWHGVIDFWRKPFAALYTPLSYTAWVAVAALEHRSPGQPLLPAPFHVLNLLLHTSAGVFAFLLLNELTGRAAPAWAGAMLFVLHPLQVEPVAWIAGMNNLLFGSLSLAALWQYVRFAKVGGRWRYALATLLYAAALLSKPAATVGAPIAMVLDVLVLNRPLKLSLRWLAFWFVMAGAMALVTRHLQPPDSTASPESLSARICVAVDTTGFYAVKLIAPFNLTIDYERPPQWLTQHPGAAWPGVVVLLVAAIVCLMSRTRWMRPPLAIVLLALLPVLGLVPFDFQYFSTPADRYMYLPMFGVAFLATGQMIRTRGMVAWTLALVAILLFALRSFDQVGAWQDTPSLINRQLAFDPGSSTGHKIQAVWLLAVNHHDEAEQEFRAAIAAIQREGKTGDGNIWYQYGNMLWNDGQPAQAIQMYEQAIPRTPPEQLGLAYDNLGLAFYASGNIPAARQQFLNSLKAQPENSDALRNLQGLDSMNPR